MLIVEWQRLLNHLTRTSLDLIHDYEFTMRFERAKDRAQRKGRMDSKTLSIRICAFEIPLQEMLSKVESLWKVLYEPQRFERLMHAKDASVSLPNIRTRYLLVSIKV